MGAIGAVLRADLRARWRIMTALTLFVALGAAVTIGTAIAGERTSTAFERELRATAGADLLFSGPDLEGRPENINMIVRSELDPPSLAGIPGVEQEAASGGTPLAFPEVVGLRPRDLFGAQNHFDSVFQAIPLDDRFFQTIERPRVSAGRLPDPTRPDELFVSPGLAEFAHWKVGDSVVMSWLPPGIGAHADLDITDPANEDTVNALLGRMTMRIVGIGDTVQRDRQRPSELVLTTPAFSARSDLLVQYTYHVVRVLPGADVDEVIRLAGERGLVLDQTSESAITGYHDAVRPDVVSLALFALLSGLVTIIVIGHALGRELRSGGTDSGTLGAVGATRRQLVVVGIARAAVVVVTGVGIGVLAAVLTSGALLREPAASVDPVEGIHVRVVLVVAVTIGILLGYLAITIRPVLASSRRPEGDRRIRTGGLVRLLASRGSSLPTIIGTGHALDDGAGRASVPVRMALTVGALATAVAVAATMFTAGLDRLTSVPSTYGAVWQLSLNTNYDSQRDSPDGFGCSSPDQECGDVAAVLTARMAHLRELVKDDPDVVASNPIVRDQLTVGGRTIGIYGMSDGELQPLMIEGRPPGSGEIALGRKTLNELHLSIGESTEADGGVPLRVVGVVLVPDGLPGESMGHGGIVTADTARAIDATLLPTELLLRLRPGADVKAAVARYDGLVGDDEAFGVGEQPRPTQIDDYRRIRQTPLALALFVAVVGTGMLVIGLLSGIGRRRGEYALLAALGATPRQIVRTIRTTTFVSYALVLLSGLAAGSIVGAVIWRAFERPAGTQAGVRWPTLEIALAVLVVGLTMAAAAGAAARSVRASSPGEVLRAR